jgi:hypothetical protein
MTAHPTSSYTHLKIFWALLKRDLLWMKRNTASTVVDCIAPLLTQITVFGYLFPLFGMAPSLIGPVYLGSMLNLFIQLGYSFVLKIAFDLNGNRFIDYHLTLPIPKKWLFASYAVSHMIETAIVTIPLISGGIILLHQYIPIHHINVVGFISMFLAMLCFLSTFFMLLGYSFELSWILHNIWPRILVPLWLFSAGLVPWHATSSWSPILGYIMLASPITYLAEGMRSALLGGSQYIPWYLCLIPLCVCTVVNIILFSIRVQKRLDPV